MAYGSLSSYVNDRLVELYGKQRPSNIDTQVTLEMLQEAIDKGYTQLGEMIMEA